MAYHDNGNILANCYFQDASSLYHYITEYILHISSLRTCRSGEHVTSAVAS